MTPVFWASFPISTRCAYGLPPYSLMMPVIHPGAVLAYASWFALSNSSILHPATETFTTPTLTSFGRWATIVRPK